MSDLFKAFEPISLKEWKNQVQVELKGANFTDALCWDTIEGFQVKPLYTKEDVKNSSFVSEKNNWKIVCDFQPGADIDYSQLDGIYLKEGENSEFVPMKNELVFMGAKNQLATTKIPNENAYFDWDFLSDLTKYGNYATGSKDENIKRLQELQAVGYNNSVTINIGHYQNAGANHAEQLALMLLEATEYIAQTDDTSILSNVLVKTSVGNNIFFEIAKIRAIRILMENLTQAYGIKSNVEIFAVSSLRNKSMMDKYNNIIRTTFEAAAAIFGGADYVKIYPYDELFVERKDIALELGFKQQFVLREESFLNNYVDPLKGSYYVEFLTEQLADRAWKIFKQFEKDGGFLAGLKSEKIQNMIKASADKEQALFDNNEFNLIGVNKFPKADDDFIKYTPQEKLKASGKTLFKTIPTRRLAEKTELAYDQTER